MSFKPFFIHINPNQPGVLHGRKLRAVTVRVSPNMEDAMGCNVQVAMCSKNDQFVKDIGRTIASASMSHAVNKRALPGKLAELHMLCGEDVHAYEYNYALRNFL